jgi:ABC-type Co2+ transport system permease subunit
VNAYLMLYRLFIGSSASDLFLAAVDSYNKLAALLFYGAYFVLFRVIFASIFLCKKKEEKKMMMMMLMMMMMVVMMMMSSFNCRSYTYQCAHLIGGPCLVPMPRPLAAILGDAYLRLCELQELVGKDAPMPTFQV